ncbi:MAG: SAVED domain-containing protein [Pseudomonas sp.]|nr:SAVED domain-containing protein [Pseudomonas sp.]
MLTKVLLKERFYKMMKVVQVVLSFLLRCLEASRNPTLNGIAKIMLMASLGGLAVITGTFNIPTQWGPLTLTLGGGDAILCTSLLVISLLMIFYSEYQNKKEADDSQLIKIRHMGLIDHSIDDVQNYMPRKLKRIKAQPFDIEFDNSHKTTKIDELQQQLDQISRLPQTIKDSGRSLNNGKKHLVYGAVAPVPMLAAAGHLISNMQNVHIADWDREAKKWHFNDQLDDGENLKFEALDKKDDSAIAVSIAISLSLPLRLHKIKEEFSGSALYHIKSESQGYDKICSKIKQERLAKSILEFINNEVMPNYSNLNQLDFFVAAQASFIFQLGTVLNQGHLPKIVFHHFNPANEVKTHPWGVVINSGTYEVVA